MYIEPVETNREEVAVEVAVVVALVDYVVYGEIKMTNTSECNDGEKKKTTRVSKQRTDSFSPVCVCTCPTSIYSGVRSL
jgi:hypothetical protein